MTITLWTRKPVSAYATSSEALVNYLGLDVKIAYAGESDSDGKKFDELFAPGDRFTPALYDTSNGLVINQAVAVNRYLLSLSRENMKGLDGKNPTDKYEALMWTNRADSDAWKKWLPIVLAQVKGEKLTQEQIDAHVANADPFFELFEQHLRKNTYVVGEQVTIADIEIAGLLHPGFHFFVTKDWQKKHPSVVRWAQTILNSKIYEFKFGGKFKFLGTAKDFFNPPAADAKPAEKAAPAEPEQKKKAAHPLAELGPSSIPIDELKRTYSNKETREEALPWFWNTFYNDDEWSLWKVDYKYNDELTLTFMSNNLIGGFFNRLLASTKYIFGAAVVYGENNNNGIRGAFVVRGKDFAPAFDVAPDWESYSFTKLDATKEADREELNDLWAWDKPLVVNGEKRDIADGKVFK